MDIPLIGQPKMLGATMTVVIQCPCGTALPLLSQVVNAQLQSVPNRCDCLQFYAIGGIATVDGQIAFTFTHVLAPTDH